MNKSLNELISVSNEVGANATLVQGGGGNTSVKTDDGRMYVKASGTSLKEMDEESGYRCVDVEACLDILDDPDLEGMDASQREQEVARRLNTACVDEGEARPSVETILHAQLGRCVVHTHPTLLNGVLCSQQAPEAVAELFGDLEQPYLYIEYTDFGYPLARRMQKELNKYQEEHGALPRVMFLENHGLFVSEESKAEAVERTYTIVDAAKEAWQNRRQRTEKRDTFTPDREVETQLVNDVCAVMRRTYADILDQSVLVQFSLPTSAQRFFSTPNCEQLAQCGPLVPDQVVYCNHGPLWLSDAHEEGLAARVEEVIRDNAAEGGTPTCLLVDGLGVFSVGVSPSMLDSALNTVKSALDMLVVADTFGGPRPLTDSAVQTIRDSEAESYRAGILAGQEQAGELAGKVALVTGGGSGLGRGISIGLAKRGMHVVLADIDKKGADETERRIREEVDAPGSGWPMKVDVTSEESVTNLYESAVRNLGGVDLLVNCAGVAPPHALMDFPVEDFRLALEVNLTGYLLMAREAARVMKRQQMGGSIINLSSKSGLDASKNHSAYNATKAGEIHLARGWAQELAEHGIRVNTVCPGNVFRESSIWNEDYIEALAEKRGLEPEEVIPYYINMTALKEEIDWDDIADAVAFLSGPHSSKITGQTLVVDAGQVFVR